MYRLREVVHCQLGHGHPSLEPSANVFQRCLAIELSAGELIGKLHHAIIRHSHPMGVVLDPDHRLQCRLQHGKERTQCQFRCKEVIVRRVLRVCYLGQADEQARCIGKGRG